MKVLSTETRKVKTECGDIEYIFERKNIKNINLRIRHNGSIFVSVPENVAENIADSFVISKCRYIRTAVDTFESNEIPKAEMKYVSGENVTLLGKNMRISIIKDAEEYVNTDGIYVYIHVRRPDYYNRKKNLLNNWLNEQCGIIFNECLPNKGIITLNKRLIEAPKNCIEYVVYHEFCHFIHPNHSKQFYSLLQVMLPDWRESKQLLENHIVL